VRVCFVCSGNICRSPTAEAILRTMLRNATADHVEVESAGTGEWYLGDDMDRRARAALTAHEYHHPRHIARRFDATGFDKYDLIVALDRGHVDELTELASDADDPVAAREKIVLLRSFDPDAVALGDLDVPDPGFGDDQGFTDALRQIERACRGMVAALAPKDARE
jgi:protein-tyrosine phosphatase